MPSIQSSSSSSSSSNNSSALVKVPELALMGKAGVGSGVQNLVTCVYETKLAGLCRQVTLTWTKSSTGGQGLYVTVDNPGHMCKVQMNPWFFWRKHGSKVLEVSGGATRVEVFWDLSAARFSCGPEPTSGYYVAIVADGEISLLLGDKAKEAMGRVRAKPAAILATLLSRKEHVFGKRLFTTQLQLENGGKVHDVAIECQTDAATKEPWLALRVDRQCVLQIKSLNWKFRGNQTVSVDGAPVEIFWDVHNWLFQPGCSGGGIGNANRISNHAMFIFRSGHPGAKKPRSVSGDLGAIARLSGNRSLRQSRDLEAVASSLSSLLYAWRIE